MRRSFGSLVAVLCALSLTASCARPRHDTVYVPPTPTPRAATELRAVWVSDTSRLDWDSATTELRRAGFNTMYVNLASAGGAFYPGSKVLPNISGETTDPVGRGIRLAHQRGLAVHAKQIALFMFKAPEQYQRQMIRADRVMRGPDGKPIVQAGNAWLCPSQPANRTLVASATTEMISRYNVDGLQFDYIRFSEEPGCFCANCRHDFERSIGTRVHRWPADVLQGPLVTRFNQWRQQLIAGWVRDLTATARQVRPGLTLSAAVFSDLNRAREEKAQDWKLWLDRGYLDYVCTMTYTPDPTEFESLVRRQQAWAGRRSQVVVGIGSWKFDRMSQLTRQIDATRRLGAPGFALFSYDDAAARDFLPTLGSQSLAYQSSH